MNSHIFLSYSRTDETFVSEVASLLRGRGLEIWQDIAGKSAGIPYSTKWFEAIEDAIYSAGGAVVFDSAAWQRSTPCSKEYGLINAARVPCFSISPDEVENAEEAADQIASWAAAEVDTEENADRLWLVSRAYRFSTGEPIENLVPKATKVVDNVILAVSLFARRKDFKERFKKDDVNCADGVGLVDVFCTVANRALLTRGILAVVGLVFVVAAFVLIGSLSSTASTYLSRVETFKTVGIHTNKQIEALETEPLLELAGPATQGLLNDRNTCYLYSGPAIQALSKSFPAKKYESGSKGASAYKTIPSISYSSEYAVRLRSDSGYVDIEDIATGNRCGFSIDAVPDGCSFDVEGKAVAIFASNVVYVADLRGSVRPFELEGNAEQIVRVGFEGQAVFAETKEGDVVVWDSPFMPMGDSDYSIEGAAVFSLGGENRACCLTEDAFLAIGEGVVSEHAIPLNGNPAIDSIVMSPDKALAAFVVFDDGVSHIVGVDSRTGNLSFDYAIDAKLSKIAFSADGDKVACVSEQKDCVFEIGLENGEVRQSVSLRNRPIADALFSIVGFNSEYVVSTGLGYCAILDANLKQTTDWFHFCGRFAVPAKQAAIGKEFLFTANRGGGLGTGCTKLDLRTGMYSNLLIPGCISQISNTAVTVSSDGRRVAYGFADGQTLVYGVDELDLLDVRRKVPESIAALSFADDNVSLIALGKSGTLYHISCLDLEASTEESPAYVENWAKISELCRERILALQEIGLALEYQLE